MVALTAVTLGVGPMQPVSLAGEPVAEASGQQGIEVPTAPDQQIAMFDKVVDPSLPGPERILRVAMVLAMFHQAPRTGQPPEDLVTQFGMDIARMHQCPDTPEELGRAWVKWAATAGLSLLKMADDTVTMVEAAVREGRKFGSGEPTFKAPDNTCAVAIGVYAKIRKAERDRKAR
jgi:hypothetical protein